LCVRPPVFHVVRSKLKETARAVGKVQQECKIAVDPDEYAEKFNPDLIEVCVCVPVCVCVCMWYGCLHVSASACGMNVSTCPSVSLSLPLLPPPPPGRPFTPP
jgi:hypothetical protein